MESELGKPGSLGKPMSTWKTVVRMELCADDRCLFTAHVVQMLHSADILPSHEGKVHIKFLVKDCPAWNHNLVRQTCFFHWSTELLAPRTNGLRTAGEL